MNVSVLSRRSLTIKLAGALALSGSLATGISKMQAQSATPEATPAGSSSVVSGPGSDEVTITHLQGETVVKINPEVVLSFDIASIDTLAALGLTVDGLPELNSGADRYDTEDAISIGTLFEPDYEAVNAAAPDLIIVAGRSAAAYPELSKIAPTIDLSNSGGSFVGDLATNAGILGAIFQKEAEVAALLEEINVRVEALRVQAASVGTGLVIMTSGGSITALAPDNARAGRGSLIYQTLGIVPPLQDIEEATHGEPISSEFLLEHNPDWLFVIDRDAATGTEDGQPAEQVLDNELVQQTTAWQQGQIVYLDAFDWYIITGAGLNSMGRMLTELEVIFNA